MNVLQGEAAALDALVAFVRPLEMTDQALADVELIPAAHAYGAYMVWLAMYGSDEDYASRPPARRSSRRNRAFTSVKSRNKAPWPQRRRATLPR